MYPPAKVKSHASRIPHWLKFILSASLALFGLCFLSLFAYLLVHFLWDDFYGTTIEALTRYPNSALIWSGYGYSGGSSEYGYKVYYRWTADSPDTVSAYYAQFPETWRADVIAIGDVNAENLWVCNLIGFWHRDSYYDPNAQSRNIGCEAVQQALLNYQSGSLITYMHDYLSG